MGNTIKHQSGLRKLGEFIQLSVIALCIYLIYVISVAVLNEVPYLTRGNFMRIQFWICIYFTAVFFVEFFIAGKNKWRYLRSHFIFLFISVPYLNLIAFFNAPSDMPFWSRMFDMGEIVRLHIPAETIAFLKFIPLLRGGYALAFVVTWFSTNRISSLFLSYLITLMSTIYFGSLIFFEIEHTANPLVHTYGDAAWWAFMDVTTVGSNIYAVSVTGKVLSVVLAALGMMMFPIFTVYITNLMKEKVREGKRGKGSANLVAPSGPAAVSAAAETPSPLRGGKSIPDGTYSRTSAAAPPYPVVSAATSGTASGKPGGKKAVKRKNTGKGVTGKEK